MQPEKVKSIGYTISILSVLLLGAAAWNNMADNPATRLLLILGMATSIGGMLLRWLSYEQEHKAKAAARRPQGRSRPAT